MVYTIINLINDHRRIGRYIILFYSDYGKRKFVPSRQNFVSNEKFYI